MKKIEPFETGDIYKAIEIGELIEWLKQFPKDGKVWLQIDNAMGWDDQCVRACPIPDSKDIRLSSYLIDAPY